MTIILDMGGVLMRHNMPGCMAKFDALMEPEQRQAVLGLLSNGEGKPGSLMDRFELGLVDRQSFVDTILTHAHPGTTVRQVEEAWNTMHAGIPDERIAQLKRWQQQGYPLLLLSNNNPLHWQDILDHYDTSLFDYTIASFEVHACKPQPMIFSIMQQYLLSHAYTPPYLFVDDLEANRLTGESFGWITFASLEQLQQYLDKMR